MLNVIPVDVTGLNNYHDIKDIETVEVQPNYTLYAAIVIVCSGRPYSTDLAYFPAKKKLPAISTPVC